MFSHRYHAHPNAHLIQADSLDSAHRQLVALRKKTGPIGRLEIFAHGSVGMLWLGPNRAIRETDIHSGTPSFEGVFSPGAQVRVRSCMVGRGETGKQFGEKLGQLLLPQGGTLYLSKNYYAAPGTTLMMRYDTEEKRFAGDLLETIANHFRGTSPIWGAYFTHKELSNAAQLSPSGSPWDSEDLFSENQIRKIQVNKK